MRKMWWIIALTGLSCLLLVGGASAQNLETSAGIQELSAAAGLRTEIQRLSEQRRGPFWIAYQVPVVDTVGGICCQGTCRLEAKKEDEHIFETSKRSSNLQPELIMLLRVEQGRIGKIRGFTNDCGLDAGGLPIVRLRDVRPEESVALLADVATPRTAGGSLRQWALSTLGLHKGRVADEALFRFAREGDEEARRIAVVQVGRTRGAAGFEELRERLAEDESQSVRRQVLFALAMSDVPASEDLLLETARRNPSPELRGHALVLYTNKVGSRALPVLREAMASDPAAQVRSSAVFAAAHLPGSEGDEILAELAHHSDPAVRQHARSMLEIATKPKPPGRTPPRGPRPRGTPRRGTPSSERPSPRLP